MSRSRALRLGLLLRISHGSELVPREKGSDCRRRRPFAIFVFVSSRSNATTARIVLRGLADGARPFGKKFAHPRAEKRSIRTRQGCWLRSVPLFLHRKHKSHGRSIDSLADRRDT